MFGGGRWQKRGCAEVGGGEVRSRERGGNENEMEQTRCQDGENDRAELRAKDARRQMERGGRGGEGHKLLLL